MSDDVDMTPEASSIGHVRATGNTDPLSDNASGPRPQIGPAAPPPGYIKPPGEGLRLSFWHALSQHPTKQTMKTRLNLAAMASAANTNRTTRRLILHLVNCERARALTLHCQILLRSSGRCPTGRRNGRRWGAVSESTAKTSPNAEDAGANSQAALP